MPEPLSGETPINEDVLLQDCPWWIRALIIGLSRFGIATILVLVGGYFLAYNVADPIIKAYTKNLDSTTEAIKMNAETNKQTSKAISDIMVLEAKQMEQADVVLRNQQAIIDASKQGLEDHKRIMMSLQNTSKGGQP